MVKYLHGGELDEEGWFVQARRVLSPNADARPAGERIELVVLHNISLPPGEFGSRAIEQFFTNQLSPTEHPYFAEIAHLRVSAHFLVRRDGEIVQFVPCHARAWHAGVSCWRGRERCNDFSIGIEIEGTDHQVFTEVQYEAVAKLYRVLCQRYPLLGIAGHEHIAPGRKTDPGPYWDWAKLTKMAQIPPEHLPSPEGQIF